MAADTQPGRRVADTAAWVSQADSEPFRAALERVCAICRAKRGELCWNTINPMIPLPGRILHYGR